MAGDKALVMISLVIILAIYIFAKEKEFYSANETYVLTNEEDATKCQSNNETTFSDSG